MTGRIWKLSPSDFAFLWEECRRCFYLKAVYGFQRPRTIMPKIFVLIDSFMKQHYAGRRTESIDPSIPPGVVEYGEKWVESKPISVDGRASRYFIRGKFDTVFRFDNGTYGVVDFKTSERRSQHIPLYSRQLHAYALALENPGPDQLELSPVTKLGLLVFEPSTYTQGKSGKVGLVGRTAWIDMPRDDRHFTSFISEVLQVLESPSLPPQGKDCPFCAYRQSSSKKGL